MVFGRSIYYHYICEEFFIKNYANTLILRFFARSQTSTSNEKSNSLPSGPTIANISKLFVTNELSRFRSGVLILLSAENPRSQSAVDAGIKSPINEILKRFGKIHSKSLFFTTKFITSDAS